MVVESNISDALLFDRNQSLTDKPTDHPSKPSDKIELMEVFGSGMMVKSTVHDERNGILYPTLSHSSEMFEFYDGLCATLQNYTM